MSTIKQIDAIQSENMAQRSAKLVIVGIVIFSAILTLLDIIAPEYDPLVNYGSDHLNGPYRWVMTVAFLALGFGYWFLADSIRRAFSSPIYSRVAVSMIRVSAIGFMLAGIFPDYSAVKPEDSFTQLEGTSTLIHLLSALVSFLFLIIAYNILSNRLRKAGRLKGMSRPLQWQAICTGLAFIVMLATNLGEDVPGLGQRIFIYVFLFPWAIVTALGIRSGQLMDE